MRAASRLLDGRGEHSRHRNYLQDRRAGPASGARIRSRCSRRPRWSAPISPWRRWRSRSLRPSPDAARVTAHRTARRHGPGHRRELQRQPGLGRRGAGLARPGAGRRARPAHRRARRHAGTRAARPRLASRAVRGGRGQRDRSGVLLRAADARACGRLFPPAAAAAMQRTRRRSSRKSLSAIRGGDAVMVKGSLGSRMAPIVKALQKLAARRDSLRNRVRTRLMRCSIGWSICRTRFPSSTCSATSRSAPAAPSSPRCCSSSCSARPSSTSAAAAGQGPADPRRRAEVPHHQQGRHADHGRADDPVRHAGLDAAVGQPRQPLCLGRALGHARLRPGRLL